MLLLCVGVLCLVSRLDEVECGCGNPGAFWSGFGGAEVGCCCFGESCREVVAPSGVGVEGVVGVLWGNVWGSVP